MRLWSLHPKYLDARGLVALWREALLAQHVLLGRTTGYRAHPQLERFKASPDPVRTIGAYMRHVAAEAKARGYRFDARKIAQSGGVTGAMAVTSGQMAFELAHLKRKLALRDPARHERTAALDRADPHPLFHIVKGAIAPWERF